jgi:hypothetical protein
MALEVTVRLTRYDPVITEMAPFTTPREFLLWGHRFFPIYVFAIVSIKKVFYVDMEKHHQRVLIHMLEKNMVSSRLLSARCKLQLTLHIRVSWFDRKRWRSSEA